MPGTLLLVGLAGAVFAAYLTWSTWSFLRDIPGPFFAHFTDLWRLLIVSRGRAEHVQLRLHKTYGPAVRIGPKNVILNSPDLIRTIYTTRDTWTKSDFYAVNDFKAGHVTLSTTFGTRDEDWHTMMMKSINRYYSLSSVLRFEGLVDRTINVFLDQLDKRFVSRNQPCPIDRWLHYCKS